MGDLRPATLRVRMLGKGQSNNLSGLGLYALGLRTGYCKGFFKEHADVDLHTRLLTSACSPSSKARVYARTRKDSARRGRSVKHNMLCCPMSSTCVSSIQLLGHRCRHAAQGRLHGQATPH